MRRLFCGILLSALAFSTTVVQADTRAPYLQLGTPTSMTVVWMTDSNQETRVCYGTSVTGLSSEASVAGRRTRHEVTISGLTPSSVYYYAAGVGSCPAAGDPSDYFITSPMPGTTGPVRLWVVGDSGTGGSAQRSVLGAMLDVTTGARPDLFLHVGDMAYGSGTRREFTNNFFSVYASVLRNTPTWPAIGNHEGYTSDSDSQTGSYYDAYVLPRGAEAGGLASGTEAYYSFDYANIHFIVLDSYETNRASTGPMLSWLRDDLAATSQTWLVAFWHHPPYSDGTHDDFETELQDMRENALPILEAAGVDLVLGGHSHIYERSWLMHGAYTYSHPSDALSRRLDTGDGMATASGGDGAYNATGPGTVYVVAGHGGAGLGDDEDGDGRPHPLMYRSQLYHGSCIIDVSESELTVYNVATASGGGGTVIDEVTLVKEEGLFLTQPMGGERYLAGSDVELRWTSVGVAGDVRIDYSLDRGTSWLSIVASTANDGSYTWATPSVRADAVRVRVSALSMPSTSAQSTDFTLTDEVETESVTFGGVWEYQDDGVAPASDWTTSSGGWSMGTAQFGFGDSDENTTVSRNAGGSRIQTYYFRQSFTVVGEVLSADLDVLFDDGFVAYINGTEVSRENVDGTEHGAWATSTSSDNDRNRTSMDPALLVPGANTLAVLVKNRSAISSDLSFDASLTLRVRVMLPPPPPVDAGVVEMDAGAPSPSDAGAMMPVEDAGTPSSPEDAGSDVGDARDAGTPSMPARPVDDSPLESDGCGCRIGAGGSGHVRTWSWLAFFAVTIYRVRRRRQS